MSRFRKERRRPSLHMAPLIDCVLLLLIFFMLTATYINRGIPVDLPPAQAGEPIEKGAMIAISRQGELFLDSQPVTLEELAEQLGRRADTLERILLKADRDVAFGRVVEVIDLTRDLGPGLSLLTEPGQSNGDK